MPAFGGDVAPRARRPHAERAQRCGGAGRAAAQAAAAARPRGGGRSGHRVAVRETRFPITRERRRRRAPGSARQPRPTAFHSALSETGRKSDQRGYGVRIGRPAGRLSGRRTEPCAELALVRDPCGADLGLAVMEHAAEPRATGAGRPCRRPCTPAGSWAVGPLPGASLCAPAQYPQESVSRICRGSTGGKCMSSTPPSGSPGRRDA